MDRRSFLTLGTAVTLAGTGITIFPATAQEGAPQLFTAVQKRSFGDWTIVALSDGFMPFSTGLLIGIEPADAEAMIRTAFQDPANFVGAVNAYLIDTGETLILVDTGTGSVFGPTLGHVAQNLTAAGYDPAKVSSILCTHLHPDHIGGCMAPGGNPFPNAEFVVSQTDYAFFTDPAIRAGAPDDFKPFFDLAIGVTDMFSDRMALIEPGATVAPGITALPLPGHTPGHMGYALEGADETLLIWGDVVHVPAVQFARPDVALVFDTDPEQAAKTRAKVLDQVATDRMMVAGMHLLFPGFGYLETASEGYRFIPAPWDYS